MPENETMKMKIVPSHIKAYEKSLANGAEGSLKLSFLKGSNSVESLKSGKGSFRGKSDLENRESKVILLNFRGRSQEYY